MCIFVPQKRCTPYGYMAYRTIICTYTYTTTTTLVALISLFLVACKHQKITAEPLSPSHHHKLAGSDILHNVPQDQLSQGYLLKGGWQNLPVPLFVANNYTSSMKAALEHGMAAWEIAVGKQLFSVQGETEPAKHSPHLANTLLRDGKNAIYFETKLTNNHKPILGITYFYSNWAYEHSEAKRIQTDAQGNKIAYLAEVDIYLSLPLENEFCWECSWSKDGKQGGRDEAMRRATTHELGHLLGLAHIPDTTDPTSVMSFPPNTSNQVPSQADILRIQEIYSCTGTSCNIHNVLTTLSNQECCQRTYDK